MQRASVGLVLLSLTAAVAAQQPRLDAADANAVRAVLAWQQQLTDGAERATAWTRGYDERYFGYDHVGVAGVGRQHEFAAEYASLAVLWPQRVAMVGARPVLATSLGHVLLGPLLEPGSDWQPELASVTGQGVEPHLNNMLLQSGVANDGTAWRRIDDSVALLPVDQRVRVKGLIDSHIVCTTVEIGAPRFAWHPGWLRLGDRTAVAIRAGLEKRGDKLAVAAAPGLRARGLQLALHGCGFGVVLAADDVAVDAGELVVTVPDDAIVSAPILDRQAWAAEALRRLLTFQLAARDRAAIDADGDGTGEFGAVDEVVPPAQAGNLLPLDNGRYLFEGHLFELHLAAGAAGVDARERGFVAYAWPGTLQHRKMRPLAFFVDQRGVVHACDAGDRFGGHDRAPARDARDDTALGWRPLR